MWTGVWLCVLVVSTWLQLALTQTDDGFDKNEATQQFAMELIKEVLEETSGNVVFSPVSVSTLLAILQQGAMGNTLNQLTQVLHTEPEETRGIYSKLISNLKKSTNSPLIIEFATKAFVNTNLNIDPNFKNIISRDFFSDIEAVDFAQKKIAAQKMNSWVEKQTHNKISEIVKPDILDASVRMLLANAIYFKGIWATPFKMEDTEDGIFHPSPSETIMVPTMHHLSYMKAAEDPYLSCKWVELPFDGKQFSMILMLPGNGLDTNTLAERMSSSNGLHSIFKNGRRRNVRLGLPKFKLSSEMKLGPALMKLGVQDVFSERDSDLRGISNMPLFVSHALHKSEISIDERGGSAASATAVVMKMRSAFAPAMDVMDVIFNRPFLVYIVDIVNKVPLFAGRVSDPSKT